MLVGGLIQGPTNWRKQQKQKEKERKKNIHHRHHQLYWCTCFFFIHNSFPYMPSLNVAIAKLQTHKGRTPQKWRKCWVRRGTGFNTSQHNFSKPTHNDEASGHSHNTLGPYFLTTMGAWRTTTPPPIFVLPVNSFQKNPH